MIPHLVAVCPPGAGSVNIFPSCHPLLTLRSSSHNLRYCQVVSKLYWVKSNLYYEYQTMLCYELIDSLTVVLCFLPFLSQVWSMVCVAHRTTLNLKCPCENSDDRNANQEEHEEKPFLSMRQGLLHGSWSMGLAFPVLGWGYRWDAGDHP